MEGDILAAVEAEVPAMTSLLAELVAAPTLLGDEAPGQEVMRRAFRALGLEPFEHEHGVDERVHLPSVTATATATAIAVFIADWCGVAEVG